MKFHLNFTVPKPAFQIDHKQSSFLIGSCFSENIGEKLSDSKFKILSNPGGILFNPLSIYGFLKNILSNTKEHRPFLLQRDHNYYSYLHHSSIHANSESKLLEEINTISAHSLEFIKNCNYLFITFGTAYYYEHKALKTCVANCHKQNADTFEKKLLTADEIVSLYKALFIELRAHNPKLKIIFTVSPVKHLKDGLIENSLSKSTLLLAVHRLISENPACSYFPAYELVNDDLRDYRFYKEDLAHPNQQAIDYVWEKFTACYFSEKTQELNQQIHKLQLALNHRKTQENSPEALKLEDFISKQQEEIKKLFPEIIF